ncbi:peptidylprolyl isomerase [Flavobacterium cyanobacteriorum]|uniref:Periplasmic chaperone PpiD n=1 Tax=Flavobacterium cyanobacteriorum TaxID=2022802 RepID=A0A255YYS4_9FLAO|nr:peptidylprolyl isomerase [Flavobacterium cyanobacteriorum]OYQ34386.1 peptidylprolyl isomerase [Flavobacterium cyanobacteriorum]
MAVLQKIRQRSLLLILIIGLSLLAFIIGDIINSGGFGSVSRNVGSVNGENIPVQDFLQKVNDLSKQQQGISPTQAANAIWNQEVENILFGERFEKAGIRVSNDHVLNMYAQNPQIAQNPQFQNALGKFDKAKFKEFLANMKTTNPAQWEMVERSTPMVENAAKKQLYIAMLKAGFVATDTEAKAKYSEENDKVSFDYVYLPYTVVNDNEAKVSDDEIIAYMKKNEKKYKSEPSRDIEYVLIENKPSKEDEAEMKSRIDALLAPRIVYNSETKKNDTLPGFREVTNVEEFVNNNSDIKFDTTYVAKKDLPVEHAEQIYNLVPGQVYGSYVDNGYYKLTRMMKRKANATAKASHILIAYAGGAAPNPNIKRTKEEAKAKAEDLLKQVQANPEKFAELARTNTDDPGSAQTGGEYDNITPGQMVKPFNDFVFNNPIGKIGVVETDFGFHVIKVTGKNEAVQLATIAQKIQPSDSTSDNIFTQATKMEMDAQEKPFADVAKSLKMNIVPVNKLMYNDENVQGLGSQRGIVVWAFNEDTKKGDVKKFDVPQGHVIATVKNINDNGLISLEEAKTTVLPILRNQKKAEILKKKMTGGSLEAVAQKNGSSVLSATDVTFAAPNIPNVGPEAKVIGKAFGLAAGKTSAPIEGQSGVFLIRAKNITKAPELPNYATYTARLKQEGRGSVPSRISTALRNRAEIEDNRAELNQ